MEYPIRNSIKQIQNNLPELSGALIDAIMKRASIRSLYLVDDGISDLFPESLLEYLRLLLTVGCDGPTEDSELGWWFDFVDDSFRADLSSPGIGLDLYFEPDSASVSLVWAGSFYQNRGSISDGTHEPSAQLPYYLAEVARDSKEAAHLSNDNWNWQHIPLWNTLPVKRSTSWVDDATTPTWTFWREWYQGFLDGKPLDWELQRRVALIPDEDWQKGPEHIARLIEEIRARFELEKRLEELEAEKQVWQERARLGIGGNNPPQAIEDDRIVQEITWAPIEELKAETQSETPDKARIKTAISKLSAALIAIGKWPLGKLDKAADEFAKSLGKWGGGACAGWLALNSDKISEIIKVAQNWLGTLF